jgi:hypothetical protein
MLGDTAAKIVVGAVVAVWVVTTIVLPVAVKGYTAPPEVSTIMGTVAGAAAAVIFVRRSNGDKNGDKK